MNKKVEFYDNEINLNEVIQILVESKWLFASITTIITTIALVYSLLLPNLYQSKSLLVSAQPSSAVSGALNNLSGLANLAGVSLSNQGVDNNSEKAIEKIKSLSFFEQNILPNIFLPELMAFKSWNALSNEIEIDSALYNITTRTWTRNASHPHQKIPSSQESYEIFHEKHLIINYDKKTGFLNISIKHQSPYIAKDWVEVIVTEINSFYREKDKITSEKAISFLESKITTTNYSEIQQLIAKLLQEETQKLSLIEANESYVFEYIDPPAVMELKAEPSRVIICMIGFLLGSILSMAIIFFNHFRKKMLL